MTISVHGYLSKYSHMYPALSTSWDESSEKYETYLPILCSLFVHSLLPTVREQTARMRRLIWAFVAPHIPKTRFCMVRPS